MTIFSSFLLAREIQFHSALLVAQGTAKALGEISERLHIPGIVGEIGAGILVGPAHRASSRSMTC